MNGSREAVWRVARVHLERTGNARIEFRSGERHFRPPRLKKSVGLNGVCRHPRGVLPSLRNTYPSLLYGEYFWKGSICAELIGGLRCHQNFTWVALFFGDVEIIGKRRGVREYFLGRNGMSKGWKIIKVCEDLRTFIMGYIYIYRNEISRRVICRICEDLIMFNVEHEWT